MFVQKNHSTQLIYLACKDVQHIEGCAPSSSAQYTVGSLTPFQQHTHILVSRFFSPLKWPYANEL